MERLVSAVVLCSESVYRFTHYLFGLSNQSVVRNFQSIAGLRCFFFLISCWLITITEGPAVNPELK